MSNGRTVYNGGTAGQTDQNKIGLTHPKKKSNKPSNSFKGATDAIRDHVFEYHSLSTKTWMKAKEQFIAYAGRKYTGNEVLSLKKGQIAIKTMPRPVKPTPQDLEKWDEFDKNRFKERDRDYMRLLENKTHENLTTLQSVLWGQCDAGVQSKLRAHPEFDEDKSNVFQMMSILETLCENEGELIADDRTQKWNALIQVATFKQTEDMSLTDYHKEFKLRVKVATRAGVQLFTKEHLMETFKTSGYYGVGDGIEEFNLLEDAVKSDIEDQAAERLLAVGLGLGPVWYHPKGIANVLSFNGVATTPGYKVEYQSWVEDAFKVTNPKGQIRKFIPCRKGLYHWKAGSKKTVRFQKGGNYAGTSLLIVTVEGNKAKHSNEDVRKATRALKLQHCAGYLGEGQLMRIARRNQLMNSPITPNCVQLKNRIFGTRKNGSKQEGYR